MKLLKDLNPAQQEAVRKVKGPLLILAGAGSGKTRVLAYRIAYLLKQKNVDSSSILAITFTNKAAQEMRERISSLVGTAASAMWIGTFHATCARILRIEGHHLGFKKSFAIYDESDRTKLISTCLKDLEYDTKRFTPSSISSLISKAKNELIDADTYVDSAQTYMDEVVAEVYRL